MAIEQDITIDTESGAEVEQQQPIDAGTLETHIEDDEDDELKAEGEEHGESESEAGAGETDDEREAIRQRRREERKHRKEAQREREDTLRRELAARDAVINEMRGRLDAVERRNTGSEMAQLNAEKQKTVQVYNHFKNQIRIATEAGNGAAVADATEKMMQAQRRFDELTNYEKAYNQRGAQPQALDPRLINHAQEWMGRNNWYDPSGRDPDSRITLTVDQQLAEEGWDPTTKEYWQELDIRIKKYLPHRQNSGKINSTKPKSVVTGSGRESASTQTTNTTYKLSAERVKALKDAGIWDDPKQRAEAVKRFREFDKEHKL